MSATGRDAELARKAKVHGARYSLRIIIEARRAHIPISLGFALVEQESGFRNIFGHDPTIFVGAGVVTKAKYQDYKLMRGTPGKRMQGVGPVQLTFWTFQDKADSYGGCWIARWNIRVGFEHLGALMKDHSERVALTIYNAGTAASPDGRRYAQQVEAKQARWHRILT